MYASRALFGYPLHDCMLARMLATCNIPSSVIYSNFKQHVAA